VEELRHVSLLEAIEQGDSELGELLQQVEAMPARRVEELLRELRMR